MIDGQDSLYERLPSAIRRADAERGQPLRALCEVLGAELETLRIDAETTWDDWFIETCEEWLVPYIGELVGVRGMAASPDGTVPLRAFVAKQIAYRRRKGTVAALEELARDLAGRPARALEYFTLCLKSEHTQCVRQTPPAQVDLRDIVALTRIGSPFESFAHSADVRHIRSGRGRYNLPNIGLFVWPGEVLSIEGGNAARDTTLAEAFRFDPLGRDVPLFGAPKTEQGIESLAERKHVPRQLKRIDLFQEQQHGLNEDLSEFSVDPGVPPPAPATTWRIEIANLSGAGAGFPSARPALDTIRVDPELGRILFNPASAPSSNAVRVDYSYGASYRIGAGPFDRTPDWRSRSADVFAGEAPFFRRVTRAALPTSANALPSFSAAVLAWNAHVAALSPDEQRVATGIIALSDNESYEVGSVALALPPGARLFIAALDPPLDVGATLLRDAANDVRGVLLGDLQVFGVPAPGAERFGGGLELIGVLLAGRLRVLPGELERLALSYATLPFPNGGIEILTGAGGRNAGLVLEMNRSQCGPITGAATAARWSFVDSLVHGASAALATPDVELELSGCTVLGTTSARVLSAESSLFSGRVDVAQHQQGCFRYSYAPVGSKTPQRYRCQPDLALDGIDDSALRAQVIARIRPEFESLDAAHPAYAHLDPSTANELLTGGEGRSEIGVGHQLRWADREGNLRQALRQYLRFGLEAFFFIEPLT